MTATKASANTQWTDNVRNKLYFGKQWRFCYFSITWPILMNAAFHCVSFIFHLDPTFRYNITTSNSHSHMLFFVQSMEALMQSYLLKNQGIYFLMTPLQCFLVFHWSAFSSMLIPESTCLTEYEISWTSWDLSHETCPIPRVRSRVNFNQN